MKKIPSSPTYIIWSNAAKLQACLPPGRRLVASPLAPLGGEERYEGFCLGGAVNRAGKRLGGDAYDGVSSRECRSRAAQAAELRELHCPISASHRCHHLPPGNQELWSCKLPPLFPFDLLARALQLLPQPSYPPDHILCPFPKAPYPTGHPNSMAACVQKGNYHFYWKIRAP